MIGPIPGGGPCVAIIVAVLFIVDWGECPSLLLLLSDLLAVIGAMWCER